MSPKALLGILLAIGFLLLLPAPNLADARSFAVDRQDDEPTATACDDAIANDCSLRGAIGEANLLDEASTITIPAGHYVLSGSSYCRFQPSADPNFVITSTNPALCLSKDIALVGAGVAETILDANEPAGSTSASHPVIIVSWGLVASMEGLTVTKGNWTAGAIFLTTGGGIWNGGTLTLTDVAVTDNYGGTAGGILNRGTLTLQRTQLARNTGYSGGGVYNNQGGTVTAYDTEASFNSVSNIGGAFSNADGTMTIVNSSLHDNVARNGGGLGTSLFTTTTLINTTISGNRAFDGGGISAAGALTLRSCTVTANTAEWASELGRGSGGGIQAAMTASNTIIAGNFSAAGKPDCDASLNSEGHNLIGNTTGCAISGAGTGDLKNVDAHLAALGVNGGSTSTHVPEPESPAIDGGDPTAPGTGAPACPATDERGLLRPVGVRCDIGAVEVSGVFGLSRVLPARGGVGGTVLLHVGGNGFDPGATVRLERAGQVPIIGAPVHVDGGRSAVTATVDLTGAVEGAWDVVVTNPDDASERLNGAFVVEPAHAPDVYLQVIGPRGLRPGVPTPFTLVYGNRGNVDAFGVPLTLSVAKGMVYRLLFPVGPPPILDPEIELAWSLQRMEVDLADGTGGTNLTFLLPVVPTGATNSLQVLLTLPPELPHGESVTSFAAIGKPLLTPQPSDATVDAIVAGARAYLERLLEVEVPDEVLPILAHHAREQLNAVAEEGQALLVQTGGGAQRIHSLAWLQLELALRAGKASLPEELTWSPTSWSTHLLAALGSTLSSRVAVAASPGGPRCPITICSGAVLPEGCGCVDLGCQNNSSRSCGFPPPLPNPPGCEISGRMTVSDFVEKLKHCQMTKDHCESLPNHRVTQDENGNPFCAPNDPGGHCPRISLPNPLGAGSLDCIGTPIRTSHDPNDKIGVGGVGDGHYLLPGTPLAYTVMFENDPQFANAAAQVVVITDQLDPAKVDLASFALGTITFGSVVVPLPANVQQYTGGVDLRPAQNLLVTIDAGIDLETGLVHWTFTSVDPATMELTTDADAGFLPVNTNAPEGEGSVSFMVMPKSDLASGTSICNGASIVFDVNEPLATPTWCNGFDQTPPASAVAALPATQTSSDIALTWSGTDVGAGIASYSIYVSTDGGPFTPFLTDTTDTTATFSGATGSTYAFYSVALDALGNRESAPLAGDAQTQIVAVLRDLAITGVKVAKSVKLSAKKPSRSVVLTVRIQNRGTRQESIPTVDALATLVDLEVESLGACASSTPTAKAPKNLLKKPLVLKSKKSMTVKFAVSIGCANDPAKSPKGETSAHDYGFVARLGTLGGADAYEADDVCPRTVIGSGSVTRPAGIFPERGCGAPLGRKTFGGPVLLDVVGPGAGAP